MTPEGKVKAIVRKHLDYCGCWYFMPPANGFGRAGIPDFIASVGGMLVAIETKAVGGKTTALQRREIDKINASGAVALVITGEDEAHDLLNQLKERGLI
jgi:Holliday junction resolvase